MTEQYIEELIRKYAEGTASPTEIQKLMEWYSLSHPGEVQWPAEKTSEKEMVSKRMLRRLQDRITSNPARVIHFPWQKIAAILFVFFGVATILIFSLKSSRTSLVTITNPSGKVQLVTLPDSSRVWLNASTIIHYPESFGQGRQVKLEGEAYFEVTHDADHPFTVEAGGLKTMVLGTAFNINALESGSSIKVSVISGRVKVTDDSRELGILSPAEELKFDRRTKTRTIAPIDTSNVLAWKNGKLKFNGESLAEIALVLENWYDIKIQLQNDSVAACRYYMSVENTTPLENLLDMLSTVSEFRYDINKERTVVKIYGQGCPESEL